MSYNELLNTVGGGTVSGTLISSIVKLGAFLYETGRAVGSAIRYITSGKRC